MLVTYLGIKPTEVANEVSGTRGAHARIKFLKELYKDHLQWVRNVRIDDIQVDYHRQCILRCYLMFLVGISIFVNKSVTYVDVVYLKYFIDLTKIYEYKWGTLCLV